jgi:peptidyl-prolyl cis-trans isomerase-like protein 2
MAKKLARKAGAGQTSQPEKASATKDGDDVNWFGVKVGTDNSISASGPVGGVGKYLSLKRPAETKDTASGEAAGEDGKKKRKLGFGDFAGW